MEPKGTPTNPNSEAPIRERVDALVAQMTLEEKVLQMVYDAPAIERLGIPAYNWWNECLHGVGRAGVATVFPQAIGLAATWNVDLMDQVARAISDEARAKHHEADRRGIRQIYTGLTFWSPNINICRDPRWGRGQETYGEDPYLTARMGVSFVKGLQGDHPDYLKLVATPKHFAVHSGPESGRHQFDARVGERDLRETYLPAFEACVREGKAASVMGAYSRLNGEPCCASPRLLEQILRGEWAFDGYVVSDCEAIRDIYLHHKVVETPEEAAALAVKHGCELNCGSVYPALLEAVAQGLISEELIDRAVERLFTSRFRLGMFDPPEQITYAQIPYDVVDCAEHQALALQAARESMVLLKNEGDLLPLSKEIASIAVIGPNADEVHVLLGNYSGTPTQAVTPLEGIRRKISPVTRLYHAQGCAWVDDIRPMQAIPTACLRPDCGHSNDTGLNADYYANPAFEGDPVLSRIDRLVDFCWKGTTPLTGAWGDHFSVCWQGTLAPPVSGVYRLGVDGLSGYRLYLDGELIAEYADIHHPVLRTREMELEGGRFYALRLEFFSRGLDPQVRLLWAPPGVDQAALALEVAKKADVIVAVMGITSRLEGEEMPVNVDGFSGGDRTDIALPRPQSELLKQLGGLGKPMVLVLLNGSALALPWAADHIPAIVEAWYPGQAGGEALADVLFGDYNPGGRLPVTFYQSVEDLPPFEDYDMAGRTYRFFRGEPLFAFGHGLSYTTFEFRDLQIHPTQATAGGKVAVSTRVSNRGERAGDEVVQLYIRKESASARCPVKELKGFARVGLHAGESKTVTFHLAVEQLASYNNNLNLVLEPGEIQVMVGSSSDDIRLSGQLEITGMATMPVKERVFGCSVEIG